MIKATKTKQSPAPAVPFSDSDIALLAGYFSIANDTDQIIKQGRIATLTDNMRDDESRIDQRRQDIDNYERNIREYNDERDILERELQDTPPPASVSPDYARADIERARALPYIKSLNVERQTIDGTDYTFIVAETRANSLYTTLEKKFSRSDRWYKVKPYRIPLPTYSIRIGTLPYKTHAQNNRALAIALNDPADTAHFHPNDRYNHEPHPHWGTRQADTGEYKYKAVCLGEYESEVSSAFRRSIADGLTALAVYLQTAGTESAYVHDREIWALWLGKKEINALLIPSATESKKLEATGESVDDENTCDNNCYESEEDGGERQCDDDCDCACHN